MLALAGIVSILTLIFGGIAAVLIGSWRESHERNQWEKVMQRIPEE